MTGNGAAGSEYQVKDRRPLPGNIRALSAGLARLLVRWKISPNAISIAGMVAAFLGGAALFLTRYGLGIRALFLAAAVAITLRLLANMLDGMVAIEAKRASPLGELYNEIPDRVSDATILLGAGLAAGGEVGWGMAASTLALIMAYIRAQGAVAGAPQEFCGPMAKPQRMATIIFACLYSAGAPMTWQTLALGSWRPGIMTLALALISVLALLGCWRRLVRIAEALNTQDPSTKDPQEGQSG